MANPYIHRGNESPYFDDYNADKNYMRVMYRPGRAVQARELTQSQTMLTNQISAFGGYFFKNGTPISGAKISYSISQPIIEVEFNIDNIPKFYTIENYISTFIVGNTFVCKANNEKIVITDYYINDKKYYLLFSYLGADIELGTFTHSIAQYSSVKFDVTNITTAITAACTEGTIFIDGFFAKVNKSNIVVGVNDLNKEYNIGFKINRTFVSADDDSELLDNALGSYNYKAPGADRYKISPELYSYVTGEEDVTTVDTMIDFAPGIVIRNGILIKEQPMETDGEFRDLLAKRTYEESGSYTVNPWKVVLQPNQDEIPEELSKDKTNCYYIGIEPGSGYVYGYNVKSLVTEYLSVNNSTETIDKKNVAVYVPKLTGDYYKVDITKSIKFPKIGKANLITNNNTVCGTCDIIAISNETTTNGILNVYISNLQKSVDGVVYAISQDNNTIKAILKSSELFLSGQSNPQIVKGAYSYNTPKLGEGTHPSYDTIDYFYHDVFTFTTDNNSLISCNLPNSLIDAIDVVYIYDNNDGKHIDITKLYKPIESLTLNEGIPINTVYIEGKESSIFTIGHTYTVCLYVMAKHNSYRTKIKTSKTYPYTPSSDMTSISLDVADIISCECTYIDGNGSTKQLDITFDNGQTDYFYENGTIYGTFEKDKEYTITVSYYEHISVSSSPTPGPFIAASYPVGNGISYSEIPMYKEYNLRDCLDFRIKRSDIGNAFFVSNGTQITYDTQIYLPRVDAVWVDKNGEFGITEGVPSETPEEPQEKNGTMTIYYLYNEASGLSVLPKYVNNQRHTMKDITKIKNRLSNVENVLSLSLLEQSAVNMQITDENGLNRYKTGIFTDNFSSYANSNFTHDEWNAVIDAVECSIRSPYEVEERGFTQLDESGNKVSEKNVILTNTSIGTEIFVENTSLTEATNIQSLMFHVWTGALTLTPSIDTWVNDLGITKVHEEYIETPKPPTTYRTWSVTTITDKKSTTSSSNSTSRRNANDGWGSYWNDTYRTTTTTTTANQQTKTTTETTSYTGSWAVNDEYNRMESQDDYMRERWVKFKLVGMRPGMSVTAKIDNKKLTLYKNANTTTSIGKIASDGTLEGYFKIPSKLSVGTKLVEFTDGQNTSSATAEYTANGKTVWTEVDRTYIREWNSVISTNTKTTNKKINLGSTTSTTKVSSVYVNLDPIAESFYVDSPNGIMLESIDLYFAKKDTTQNVDIIVVECDNGYPSQTMIPFSRVTKSPDEVTVYDFNDVSENDKLSKTEFLSTKRTNFKFDYPLYLAPDKEYAFIVISPSYNYEIYTSTLGKADLNTNIGLKEQPFIGSMFKSQNLRTWTAEQTSDITFRIHKYVYNITTPQEYIFEVDNLLNTGDMNKESIEQTAMQTLALNTHIPPQTDIKYYYSYMDNTRSYSKYIEFNNRQDIFNKTLLPIDGMRIKCVMSTNDKNVSPMIDTEQVYGIFTKNVVENISTTPLEYKCGTYVSNLVTLENSSNDLRVILDAILPNDSKINVYYSLLSANYRNYLIMETNSTLKNYTSNIDTSTIYYVYNYTKTTNGYTFVPTNGLCTISSIDNNTYVYINNINSVDNFGIIDETTYDTNLYLLPIKFTNNSTTIPLYDAKTTYNKDTYVVYEGYVWKCISENTTGNTPSDNSIIWTKLHSIVTKTGVHSTELSEWKQMSTVNTNNTTNSGIEFKEYTYSPSEYTNSIETLQEFTSFLIKVEMYSADEINVPRVKNLRAIAVV